MTALHNDGQKAAPAGYREPEGDKRTKDDKRTKGDNGNTEATKIIVHIAHAASPSAACSPRWQS